MDEAVALEFAANVEEAVASVRELTGSAQELADVAKEAEASVAGIAEPATAAADATKAVADSSVAAADGLKAVGDAAEGAAVKAGAYVDASGRMRDANGRFIASSTEAGAAAEGTAAKADAAAAGGLGKYKMALLGIAVGAGLAVKAASDYQDASTHLVTDAGESAKSLAMVQQGMLGISAATGTSSKDIVNGMYHVESAGYHGAQGLSVLRVAAEGAKVGGADLDTVSKSLTGTLNAYGQTSSNAATQTKMATSMMNQLIATVGAGDMRMEDLASSLGNVAPVAASAKISFSEVGGALATMTAQNMSAQQATQDLRHTILSLESPNAVQQKELKALGLSAREVQDSLGKRGLAATLQMVTEAAHKNAGALGQTYTQALYKAVGGTTGLTTSLMLTGSRMSTFQANAKAVADAARKGGDSVANWSAIQGTFAFKMSQAKASIEAAGIALGTALLPAVSAIVGPLAHMLSIIAGNRAASIALAAVVGGVLAGALGMKLAKGLKDVSEGIKVAGEGMSWIVGKIIAMTTATEAQTAATEAATVATEAEDAALAVNPIVLIILAVIALAVAIYELVKHWKTVWHDICMVVDDAVKWIKEHWKVIVAWLVDPIGMVVYEIRQHWATIKHDVSEAIDWVINFVKAHWWLILGIIMGPIALAVFFVIAHWNMVRRETVRLVDDVVSFFKRLGPEVLRELENLPAQMLTVGRNVIMGLIHGIESAASAIPSLMSGLAHTVSSYFTNPLKLFSPSRVFFEHGANIVRGAILGVQSQASALQATMRGLGTGVATGGIGGIGTAGGYGGSPSVHVQMPVTMEGTAQLYNTPQFLQYLQTAVQEAILRYNVLNPSNGLAITTGGRGL